MEKVVEMSHARGAAIARIRNFGIGKPESSALADKQLRVSFSYVSLGQIERLP